MICRLRQQAASKAEDHGARFEAIDERGNVCATGFLEVEYVSGASRHGSVAFVSEREDLSEQELLRAGAAVGAVR